MSVHESGGTPVATKGSPEHYTVVTGGIKRTPWNPLEQDFFGHRLTLTLKI